MLKARSVAKGYHQITGVDYQHSFSPVAKLVVVRLFFTIAAANHWFLHQLDVNNVFLHDTLEKEVYMLLSEVYNEVAQGKVYKLNHSIYGLNQVSRQWNKEFSTRLKEFGF